MSCITLTRILYSFQLEVYELFQYNTVKTQLGPLDWDTGVVEGMNTTTRLQCQCYTENGAQQKIKNTTMKPNQKDAFDLVGSQSLSCYVQSLYIGCPLFFSSSINRQRWRKLNISSSTPFELVVVALIDWSELQVDRSVFSRLTQLTHEHSMLFLQTPVD